MEKLEIQCEIVTPLLLHGENTKNAELRAPSIKGVMRFWWRAIHGNLSLDELREQEAKIFGGTGENDARKSSFSIIIKLNNVSTNTNETIYNKLKNEKKFGIQYNFYSLALNKQASLFSKGEFEIIFIFKDNSSKEEIIKVLNYMNFFGNLGARSRRGAGSVKFSNEKLLKFSGETKEELKEFIEKNFSKNEDSIYSTFAKKVYIFNPKNNWEDALESIAKPFKDFRGINKGRVFETPNFGFPIRHRDKSVFVGGKIKNDKCDLIERRSSPLIFKIYKSDNNKFFPIIIWLNGMLLGDDYKIVKKLNKNNCDYNNGKLPTENIISEFLQLFKDENYVEY